MNFFLNCVLKKSNIVSKFAQCLKTFPCEIKFFFLNLKENK